MPRHMPTWQSYWAYRDGSSGKIKITELPEEILDLIIGIPQISLNHAIQLTQISSNLDLCKQLIKQMATTEISRDALKKIIENKLHGTRHKASFNPFDYKPHSKGFNLEVKYRKDRPEGQASRNTRTRGDHLKAER